MSSILLADSFVYTVNNVDHVTSVFLTDSGVSVCDGKEQHSYKLKYIHLDDVIGAKVHYGAKESVYLLIHYFPLVKNRFNGKIQRCKKVAILGAFQHNCPDGNLLQCMQWKNALTGLLHTPNYKIGEPISGLHKNYLIIVNPVGGKGIAKKIWTHSVKPMFDLASIKYTLVYTEYSGHAGDYVKEEKEIYKYDSIVLLSGDGLIFEVVNGLMKRSDHQEAIKVPLTIIPAGSGNGLSAAILHQSGIPLTLMDAIFVAIRGTPTPLDLVKVEQGDKVMWSFLSIAWGLLSAVDIESEKMRWMGEARFTVEAVKKLVTFPIKSGKVSFAKADDSEVSSGHTFGSKKSSRKKRISKDPVPAVPASETKPEPENCDVIDEEACSAETLDPDFDYTGLNEVEEDSDNESQDIINNKIPDRTRTISATVDGEELQQCTCDKCTPLSPIDPVQLKRKIESIEKIGLKDEIPPTWTMLAGKFATVNSFSLSYLTLGFPVDSCMLLECGYMWLMWSESDHSDVLSVNERKDFLQLLVQNCSPENNETRTIHFEKVRAFRLEPEHTESGAYVTIDGELVPYEALHACIYKGLARVMCLEN